MNLGRATLALAGSLVLGACSNGYVVPKNSTTGHGAASTAGNVGSSSTTGGSTTGSGGGTTGTSGTSTSGGASTTGASTTGASTTGASTTGHPTGGTSGGTSPNFGPNACAPTASGLAVSFRVGGTCTVDDGGGTCVTEGFYCSIDPDAGLCADGGYVSGYPFATGADGGNEVFDIDAGQPVFPGLCTPTTGSLGLGATCSTFGPNDAFGACAAGAFCLGTCEAACDVRFPATCGDAPGQTCRSAQVVGLGGTNAAPQYPQGVCGGCQPSGYACALASECCNGSGLACLGARTSPLLDGGFAYGICGACACHGDAVNCSCAVNADCCQASDVCIAGACSACVVSGVGSCTTSTECCYSGTGGTACVLGTCQGCITDGGACQIDEDCCSGLCDEVRGLCN